MTRTVAIIGGGFSGTMAAVNLVRLSSGPLDVELINCDHPLGRGVAYGTPREEHLLNVAARNMSAVPDHPGHFLDWLRTRAEYRDMPEPQLRETYAPRRVYGDYLCGLLLNYARPIDEHQPATMHIHQDQAVDVVPQDDGRVEVALESGATLAADRVLLATGNQPPAPISANGGPFTHAGYCPDPWTDWRAKLPPPDEDVIVLGSGLTMVDTYLTLCELGWPGRLVVVSRNGMIPQAHFRGIEYPDFLPDDADQLGLARLVEILEDHCARLRRIGENPGIIVDRLRPLTQRIWRNFSPEDKRAFLSDHAARWNVIRHRIPQPIHQRITEAITDGRIQAIKGNVEGLSVDESRVRVALRTPRGDEQTITGGLVINCTGPNSGFSRTAVPLFRNLIERGLVRPDELDMGIDVGPDFAAIDAAGASSDLLFVIGPLMKGTLWETTAVPELRGQAMRVAQLLVDEVPTPDRDLRFSVEEEHVIEYYI